MRRRTRSSGGLRAWLVDNAAERRDFWVEHCEAMGRSGAYYERLHAEFVARVEAGEPIEVYAWELPDRIRDGLHPNTRVTITADGSLVIAETIDTADATVGEVIALASRRGPLS